MIECRQGVVQQSRQVGANGDAARRQQGFGAIAVGVVLDAEVVEGDGGPEEEPLL